MVGDVSDMECCLPCLLHDGLHGLRWTPMQPVSFDIPTHLAVMRLGQGADFLVHIVNGAR